MNKRNAMIGIVALIAFCGIAAGAITYDWGTDGGPTAVPFGLDENGNLADNSINSDDVVEFIALIVYG